MKKTSTSRLDVLADFCVQELTRLGLKDVEKEASIPGGGREKKWDVAWRYDGKYRLAAPGGSPLYPGAHQHYTALRRCRSCGALQMVNVGPSGEHEASAWFQAADDCMPWQSLHDAALAAGSPIGRD